MRPTARDYADFRAQLRVGRAFAKLLRHPLGLGTWTWKVTGMIVRKPLMQVRGSIMDSARDLRLYNRTNSTVGAVGTLVSGPFGLKCT